MSLDPSLFLVPSALKAGKLYSVLPTDGSGDFTVSRNGEATYFDKDGILRTVLANESRLDFDPISGEFKGVLIEPAATNVLLNSETPATQTILMTAAARTISFWGNGTVTLSGAFSQVINGNPDPLIRTRFTFTPTANNLTITPSGDVTKWQLETGSVDTSYIPTVASQVTRPADIIQRTNVADLIGQTKGSVFIDFLHYAGSSLVNELFQIWGQVNNYHIRTRISSDNILTTLFTNAGSSGVIHPNVNINIGGRNKIVIVYDFETSLGRVFHNGNLIGETALAISGSIVVQDKVHINNWFGSVNKTSFHKIAIFKRVLTDAEAIALTTL